MRWLIDALAGVFGGGGEYPTYQRPEQPRFFSSVITIKPTDWRPGAKPRIRVKAKSRPSTPEARNG